MIFVVLIAILLCPAAFAQNVVTGGGSAASVDTNSFGFGATGLLVSRSLIHMGTERIFWDDFNQGESAGKQFPPSPSGHQIIIPPEAGFWQNSGWKIDRGFLSSTASVHNFVLGFYVTNETQITRPWNSVGCTFKWRLGSGGFGGNNTVAVGFNGGATVNPNDGTHQVCLTLDGNRLWLARQFFGVTIAAWDNNSFPAVFQPLTNSIHSMSLTVVSNTYFCEFDGSVFVATDTNTVKNLTYKYPQWITYGTSNALTAQDIDSVWAGFASPATMSIADGGQQMFTSGVLGRRVATPTAANLVTNLTTYVSTTQDSEVMMPQPGSALTNTCFLPTYLTEFGRPFRVYGSSTAAGSNTWVRTPDGKPLLAKGQVTGPVMTNIQVNCGFIELEQDILGWRITIDQGR